MSDLNVPGPYVPRPKLNPLPHESIDTVKRGDYVQMWFDTGAFGANILVGIVIDSGPKSFRVRWESGLTNRIDRKSPRGVTPLRTPEIFEVSERSGLCYMLEHLHG